MYELNATTIHDCKVVSVSVFQHITDDNNHSGASFSLFAVRMQVGSLAEDLRRE